ncbi:MAG: hypothetical protein P8J87_20575, partial [Verrucomicrobiales bacterium]|nr:hypothetical protein [Verrucomicrobiales bacterium]
MKIKAIITVAALAGSVSFAAADERTFGDGGIPERIKELADTNGDDEVSEEEWQAFKGARKDERKARRADRRAEWDTDGNGLSDDEKEAARDAIRAKIEEKRNARHAEADTGGGEDGEPDGLIDIDEFVAISSIAKFAERHPEMAQAIFNRLAGTDDDAETISAEEFTSHLGKRRPVRPKFPKPSRP